MALPDAGSGGCGCSHPGPYIEILRTTPVRTVCPNFYLLDHARGCNFNCSYCFLRDEEYNRKERKIFDEKERLLREVAEWVARDDVEAFVANAGNMTDALGYEEERPMWGDLIELMREKAEAKGRPHCLLVVTKAGLRHCQAFLEHKPCRNVIVSFSINAPEAALAHEAGAAHPRERLEAAAALQKLGWRVRIRIDPMILGFDYSWVVEEIRAIAPERVTLGTLRADPTLLTEVAGVAIFQELEPPEPGSIARYPLATRLSMYRPVVERLRDVSSLGLCEETEDVWRALGLDCDNKTCNCNPF